MGGLLLLLLRGRERLAGFVTLFHRPKEKPPADAGPIATFAPPKESLSSGIESPEGFLQSEEPQEIAMSMVGWEVIGVERFFQEVERWLEQASEEELRSLVPIALTLDPQVFLEMDERLCEAYEARGIPTLDDLAAYAERTDHSWLRTYVSSRRA